MCEKTAWDLRINCEAAAASAIAERVASGQALVGRPGGLHSAAPQGECALCTNNNMISSTAQYQMP